MFHFNKRTSLLCENRQLRRAWQTHSLTKAFAARTHLGSIFVSQLSKRKAVHVDEGSDKNKSKQGRIQDFWKIDLSRGDPGFLEGGSAGSLC